MKRGWNLPANPTTSKSVVLFLLLFSCQATEPHRPCRDRTRGEHHSPLTRTPRSVGTPAAPLSRSAHPSFPQNEISKAGSGADTSNHIGVTTCLASPPPSHRITSFHRNDQQFVPAERQPDDPLVQARRVRAVFDSHPPTFSTLGGPANEPTDQPPNTTNDETRRDAETLYTLRAAVSHR